jgi:hypothetical protein
MCEAGSHSLCLRSCVSVIGLLSEDINRSIFLFLYYVYSGVQAILEHQSPMQHSRVMARWCMLALKMGLYLYLMLRIFSYTVGLIQLLTFLPLQGNLHTEMNYSRGAANLIHF